MSTQTGDGGNGSTAECPNTVDNFVVRIGCILSYGGSITDMVVNYLVLVVNLIYCVAALCRYHSPSTTTTSSSRRDNGRFAKLALTCLLFVILFQVSLCLVLECSGISIIWCAMGGWIMSERRQLLVIATTADDDDSSRSQMLLLSGRFFMDLGKVVILLDACVIVYYGVVAIPIVSVAHVCALIMGSILFGVVTMSCSHSSSESQPLL